MGKLVLYCIKEDKSLLDLSLDEYRKFSPIFDEDIFHTISLETCVNNRNIPGGPAPASMKAAIEEASNWLDELDEIKK